MNSKKEKFRITYVNKEECKKTCFELFWGKLLKNDIFFVSSLDGIEQLGEIFSHLEDKCSQEYARIKLK